MRVCREEVLLWRVGEEGVVPGGGGRVEVSAVDGGGVKESLWMVEVGGRAVVPGGREKYSAWWRWEGGGLRD